MAVREISLAEAAPHPSHHSLRSRCATLPTRRRDKNSPALNELQRMPVAAPSPLVGEGIFDAGNKPAWVRGSPNRHSSLGREIPLIRRHSRCKASAFQERRLKAAYATFSHKGRRDLL